MKIFRVIIQILKQFLKEYYFSFYSISKPINYVDTKFYKSLIKKENDNTITNFENLFSKLVGSGKSASFAAGRMGLYQLLKLLNIGREDEVIVNSGNCSVVINAILSVKAKPIFSDVDITTFGSCPDSIKRKITKKTKLVIAQHSFGIPCKIESIKQLCETNKIFMLEDCALSLESKSKGIKVGNFGDAALFSFDHTKPLNAFSGGIIYSNNIQLIKKLKRLNHKSERISFDKQILMFKRFLIEQKVFSPKKHIIKKFYNTIQSIKIRLGFLSPYLDENYNPANNNCTYPYPAKMPSFVAQIGIDSLLYEWTKIKNLRINNLKYLIDELKSDFFNNIIPDIYFDPKINIIPLRMVIILKNNEKVKSNLKSFLDYESIWFQSPIISTKSQLKNFGYLDGECPKSEILGKEIINLPLDLEPKDLKILLSKIKKTLICCQAIITLLILS
ncbi:DegT/DnrJ/EryC1/StrS family aminotransferase [Flavobacteriaceae bacterium]|nr:DegT/DnrJ/EryC1/StrS family aminotransferase [Flavobacteriaceae bacterium]